MPDPSKKITVFEGQKEIRLDRELAATFMQQNGLIVADDRTLDIMVNFTAWVLTLLGGEQVK